MPRASLLALLAAASTLWPATARAEFKEWTLAVHPSYAVAYIDSRTAHGGGPAISLGVGVSDAVSLHVSGFVAFHGADMTDKLPGGALSAYGAFVGVTYTIDVIRLVPSFDLAVGALGIRGDLAYGDNPAANAVVKPLDAFAVSLGFNIEYLINRHLAIGAHVHYQIAATAYDRLPMYLTAGPRLSFRFGG